VYVIDALDECDYRQEGDCIGVLTCTKNQNRVTEASILDKVIPQLALLNLLLLW
jgi:hypothetical protein